jgi:egghead protein (zeste-white 4 protein)
MPEALLLTILTFFWLLNIPIAFISIGRYMKNKKIFVVEDRNRIYNDPFIIFQITTRSATHTSVVERGIGSVVDSCARVNLRNYIVSVVTDDLNDLETLRHYNCEVMVVPPNFTSSAIKKGRALQYGVVARQKCCWNTDKFWIYHMDDESYVTSQTILSILRFIREGKGIVGEGPIFYPLKFESANLFTALAESIRPFTCYDCVSQMTNDVIIKTPPLHMHGSNLLVRSDIENSIGWDFGPTLAEDQMFGYLVYQKYGPKSLGWHGGILLEQPPLNIKDHFMQRRRWVVGSLQNIDKFSSLHKLKLIYKLITYFLGFAAGSISLVVSFGIHIPIFLSLFGNNSLSQAPGPDNFIRASDFILNTAYSESIFHTWVSGSSYEVGVGVLLLFSTFVWLFSYQLGLFLNFRFSHVKLSKRFVMHIQTLLFCPILGLLETFPAFWAIIEYTIRKKTSKERKTPVYDFYVINK